MRNSLAAGFAVVSVTVVVVALVAGLVGLAFPFGVSPLEVTRKAGKLHYR